MAMIFSSRIDGKQMHCELRSDRDLTSPVFCYSCMAPSVSLEGHKRIKSVGGYAELQLPDIRADEPFNFALAYENTDFAPANRAWLPMGVYLRCDKDIISLDNRTKTGVAPSTLNHESGVQPDLLVCPQPKSFSPAGKTVQIDAIRSDAPALQQVHALFQRNGLGDVISAEGLELRLKTDLSLSPEAYKLKIGERRVELSHSDDVGAFYGGITLATLMVNHESEVPCGIIEDGPRFEWRGQHLDCARHFFEIGTITRLLDLMALLKMNRFHWHFADDEAFRLELKNLPELKRTHFRGEDELVPGVFGGGARAGGSYSKEDAKSLVDHAKSLFIEVMPEIEAPAHAFSLCAVYPETRDPKDTGTETSVQSYTRNVMNPAMAESWRIWEAMIQEVSSIFPFDMIHLGGDELPENTWQGSPAAKKLMQDEGLSTTQDLQGWTMNKLAKKAVDCGKTPASWEEAALGKPAIGHGAVIFSWTGQGPGLQAAKDGHPVVMMPGQKTYFDMAQTSSFDDWGANWAAILPLVETVNWDPAPDDQPELVNNIIGIEGAFWSEFTTEDQQMEPMLAPRILGLSMLGWQTKNSASGHILLGLRARYAHFFEKVGWCQSHF